ncbi:MAG: NAD(P)-dependent dehydrogenase (short-subunit alcohol dehydrogenase family), partial [Marinomonas primoryensis]
MNKLAIITGGSRGLGRSSALALAEKGVDVLFTYHSNREAAQEVVEAIKQKGQKAFAA